MDALQTSEILFNLAAAPFGFAALYYGYKGHQVTKGGLHVYRYFFFAMFGLGVAMLFDLLRILGYFKGYGYIFEIILVVVGFFMFLSFKNLYTFLKKHE